MWVIELIVFIPKALYLLSFLDRTNIGQANVAGKFQDRL